MPALHHQVALEPSTRLTSSAVPVWLCVCGQASFCGTGFNDEQAMLRSLSRRESARARAMQVGPGTATGLYMA